ncbi:MAG: glycosyltransferase family 4 protein [candidate division Zixibacteria bacterium]|nr:glycosyltransferase family 4 protein [candidate division Zixibacteria bacterium]
MKNIRVIILIATYRIGGPGKLLFDFCEIAPDYGCEPILVGFTVGEKKTTPFIEEARKRKIRVLSVRHRFRYDPAPIVQFSSLLREHKPDIIETHGHKANFIAFVLKRFIDKPWIAYVHGWTDEDWKIRIYNRLDKFLLKFPDRVVAVSKELASKLYPLGIQERKIKVIYNAAYEKGMPEGSPPLEVRKEFKVPEENKLLGVIGRLSPEKGQIYFLQAFSKVIEIFPQVTALIVGEGPDEKKLKEYCALKKLNSQVIFTGYQKDINSIYKSLDLIVLPSLSEGMPVVALEGMFFEKPVIGTKVGGMPEVVIDRNTGILVPPEDPASLARAILELLTDESKGVTLTENARKFVLENYSLEQRVKSIIELYRELLDRV